MWASVLGLESVCVVFLNEEEEWDSANHNVYLCFIYLSIWQAD